MEHFTATGLALGGIAAAASLFAIALLLLRSAHVGLAALVGAFLLMAVAGPHSVSVAGIFITPYDIISVLFAVAAVLRSSQQRLSPARAVWLCFGLLILLSLAIGMNRFGLQTAGNEARATGFFYLWACAAYFSSFQRAVLLEDRALRILLWGAAALSLVVFLRWGLELTGYQVVDRFSDISALPFRVITSQDTLFLTTTLIILLRSTAVDGASKTLGSAIILLVIMVLLLQHRSVWFATTTGVLVLALLDWPRMRRLLPYAAIVAVVAALAVSALFVKSALDGVVDAMSYSVQDEGTFSWRVEGWTELFAQWRGSGSIHVLVGQPFGGGFHRYLDSFDMEVVANPHNGYLTLLLRCGVLGLSALLVSYCLCFKVLLGMRRQSAGGNQIDTLIAVLAAQLVYFFFYGPHIVQAAFLGAALSQTEQWRGLTRSTNFGGTMKGRAVHTGSV